MVSLDAVVMVLYNGHGRNEVEVVVLKKAGDSFPMQSHYHLLCGFPCDSHSLKPCTRIMDAEPCKYNALQYKFRMK